MPDQELRDKSGRLIGKIHKQNNGRLEIRNAAGVLKGSYDPSTDKTRDTAGRIVGTGNLLTTLL